MKSESIWTSLIRWCYLSSEGRGEGASDRLIVDLVVKPWSIQAQSDRCTLSYVIISLLYAIKSTAHSLSNRLNYMYTTGTSVIRIDGVCGGVVSTYQRGHLFEYTWLTNRGLFRKIVFDIVFVDFVRHFDKMMPWNFRDGIFNDHFVANFLENVTVKEF